MIVVLVGLAGPALASAGGPSSSAAAPAPSGAALPETGSAGGPRANPGPAPAANANPGLIASPITGLTAEGHDSRIDLVWDRVSLTDRDLFQVERSLSPDGPFRPLTEADRPHPVHVYSDWIGDNGRTFFYRVRQVLPEGELSPPSAIVSAATGAMTDDELLTSVQLATFRYFWHFGHPVSGLAREGYTTHDRSIAAAGGSGFGIMAMIAGADRGFVSREALLDRLLTITGFLEHTADRYHGAWSHWMDGATGRTIPFASPDSTDNGGDLVETAFLAQGLLAARNYFDRDDPREAELRGRLARLWESIEWDWYLGPDDRARETGGWLFWHWSPDYEFVRNHHIRGWDEGLIVYVLAIASPTHPIPPASYELGWVGPNPERQYVSTKSRFGIREIIGRQDNYQPLFFTHYSFIGLDPRQMSDRFCADYFESNRRLTLINRAWCLENPGGFEGYGPQLWGLTSSLNHEFYGAHGPSPSQDNGTVAPTAALSAMPYTPEASMAVLRHLYHDRGHETWGPFGFFDALNPTHGWVSDSYLAIDQGPIVGMIENHRTGLLWRTFMRDPDVQRGLERLAADQDARGTYPRD